MSLDVLVITSKHHPECVDICNALETASIPHMKVSGDGGYHIWKDCPGKPAIRLTDPNNGGKEIFRCFSRPGSPCDVSKLIDFYQNPPAKVGIRTNGDYSQEKNFPLKGTTDAGGNFEESLSMTVDVTAYDLDGNIDTSFNGDVLVRSSLDGDFALNLTNGVGSFTTTSSRRTNVTISLRNERPVSTYVPRFDQEVVILCFK